MNNHDPKSSNLPLSNIRVVDFSQVMMGPICTQTLADFGADVIKIERANSGDLSRSSFVCEPGRDNPIFCSLNRNKRSVALDLRNPEQIAFVKKLIGEADVVVNNFRSGVMERLGLSYDDCVKLNPRIIYAVGTGYGESGPHAHKGGQDFLAQALSGVMLRKPDPSIPTTLYPTSPADYAAGMHMVQGILLAIIHRANTGEGQKVSVSLYDSMLGMQTQEAAMVMMSDSEVNWAAMPLSGVFETQDGPLVMVGAFKENPLRNICAALGLADHSADPKFANLTVQFQNKPELQGILRKAFLTNTRVHWLEKLEEQDILCAPVRDMREALADPQTAINEMILEGPGEGQHVKLISNPVHLSRTKVTLRIPPPRLGQHTQEVIDELHARH
jgi:formyl-CoA transferase